MGTMGMMRPHRYSYLLLAAAVKLYMTSPAYTKSAPEISGADFYI